MKNLILTEISTISGGNVSSIDFSTNSIAFVGHCYKDVPGIAQKIFSSIGVDKSTKGADDQVRTACLNAGGGIWSTSYFYTNEELTNYIELFKKNGIEEQNNTLTFI